MVKILHTGDLHMDSVFTGLTGEQALERRREQRNMLRDIVELGNRENVQLLLLAGDLLDSANAYYETALALGEILGKSNAHVFIAPGNHDAYDSMSPYKSVRFPENVHIFTSNDVESVDIPELNVCVHGAAFTSSSCENSILTNFCAPEDGRVHIMVLHGEETEGGSKYNPVRESHIRQSNLNYLALGHVHTFSGVKTVGKTAYAYCGCPEGRGFDETGDKGVIMGNVSEEGVQLELVSTAKFRYHWLELELSEGDSAVEKAKDLLPERDEYGLYRLVLKGECDGVDAKGVHDALKDRFYYLAVIDRTSPVRSMWEGEDEDNLKGIFLRRLHRMYLDTGDVEQQEIIRKAVRFGTAALDNREEPV